MNLKFSKDKEMGKNCTFGTEGDWKKPVLEHCEKNKMYLVAPTFVLRRYGTWLGNQFHHLN